MASELARNARIAVAHRLSDRMAAEPLLQRVGLRACDRGERRAFLGPHLR